MTKESPDSAPMRIGGKMKQKTPVSDDAKPSPPDGTKALKRSASASNGGPTNMKTKTDKASTDKMDRAHMKPEKASTKKAVKKAEGKKPPREGMGSVGATPGRDRDYGKSLENAGQTAKKVRPRNT
jgi:hypothetical protein